MKPLHWDAINPFTGQIFTYDDPNVRWGFYLEPGDDGFVPYPHSPTTTNNKHKMSENNKISIVIPQARIDAIHQHLDAALAEILEFAAELTPEERQNSHTIGVKRGAMVATFETQMAQNPKCIPSFIEMSEKAKDVEAWKVIAAMLAKVTTILSLLEDTEHVLGSDLLTSYETFYRFSQECAGQGVAGASAVVEALKVFFPQGRRAKKPTPPPTA